MTTQRERITAIHLNRFIIWVLVVIGSVLDSPFTVGDMLSIVAATIWLWLPQLARLELKLVEYIKRRK
tara:strand:- start:165 stop:368 length:204 start_codon:yes stop_codon:yes gene_type:complete